MNIAWIEVRHDDDAEQGRSATIEVRIEEINLVDSTVLAGEIKALVNTYIAGAKP